MADTLRIEITQDGLIKISTGKISAVNHKQCDAFMEFLAKKMGGEVKVEKRAHSHAETVQTVQQKN